MSKEMEFFIYLIEHYAAYKNETTDNILRQWDKLELTEDIYSYYELYHVERIENAFDDIGRLVEERIRNN